MLLKKELDWDFAARHLIFGQGLALPGRESFESVRGVFLRPDLPRGHKLFLLQLSVSKKFILPLAVGAELLKSVHELRLALLHCRRLEMTPLDFLTLELFLPQKENAPAEPGVPYHQICLHFSSKQV